MRDLHDPRDWRRPWRDPPGFLLPKCVCCPEECVPACEPACASVGDLGSESGDECTTCANQVIYDDFSGNLSAWQFPGLDLMGCEANGAVAWHTSGGTASEYGVGAGMLRYFNRPALAGFCVEVKVKIVDMSTNTGGVGGITLGYGRYFFARPFTADYGIQSCIGEYGCTNPGSTFTVIPVTRADGDIISMTFRDEGGADGICSICYKINGAVVRVEEGVQCCFPCTMRAGLVTTGGAIKVFDDFEVRTS